MAITYTTHIDDMEHRILDGKVLIVHWSMHGTNGTYDVGTTTTGLELEGLNDIPYDQLTEEIVIGWVHDALGPEKISEIEADLASQIDALENPKTEDGLPWEEGAATLPV